MTASDFEPMDKPVEPWEPNSNIRRLRLDIDSLKGRWKRAHSMKPRSRYATRIQKLNARILAVKLSTPRMTQPPLIPFQMMATTRQIKSAQRARALALASPASATTRADNLPAKPVAAPASGVTRSPESSLEFNLPDEDRFLSVLRSLRRCPNCGTNPSLERRQKLYRVLCNIKGIGSERDCQQPTPWLPSSAAAIHHWKLVSALTKQ